MATITVPDPLRISEWRTNFLQGGDLEETKILYTFGLNNETPDAWQIITGIANFAEQYGQNPAIRAFVEAIFPQSIGNNNLPEQYNTIATFVLTNLTYVADPNGVEYLISPIQLLRQWCTTGTAYGDCDDHVLLFNSMLNSVGFETHVVGAQTDPSEPGLYTHVLSMVKLAGQNYFFDACNKSNPYETPEGKLLIL